MKSSGNINLIKSDVLRFLILDYYNFSGEVIKEHNEIRRPALQSIKNETFSRHLDLNSLIEFFMFPEELRAEVDPLNLSFFERDINSPEVQLFSNNISLIKANLLASHFSNMELLSRAERLKIKLAEYLTGESSELENDITNDIFSAIEEGNTEILKDLISNATINDCIDSKFGSSTYVDLAIFTGSMESLRHLVESGADIEVVCLNKTPLMYASKYGKLDMVKYLLESGADINFLSIKGKTALTYSVQYEHPEIEKYLIEKGATK